MTCQELARYAESFVDHEFAEPERLEAETHLLSCVSCRHLIQEQATLKAALHAGVPRPRASLALRQRITFMLDEVDRAQPPPLALPAWRRGLGRIVAPLALMAACVFFLLPRSHVQSPVLYEAVDRHQRNLPPEITGDPRAVLRWFDGRVPFAVRPPPMPSASLRGGRLISLGDREAAYLLYEQEGNKISVFVFDALGLRLQASRSRLIGTHEVYLDGTRGYNVAVFRDRGLGYAITGNIDEPDLIRMISAAVGGR